MTKEELAAKLNGREYPFEMNIAEITEAKKKTKPETHAKRLRFQKDNTLR